jgi:hypothetical protein
MKKYFEKRPKNVITCVISDIKQHIFKETSLGIVSKLLDAMSKE